MGLDVYTGPLTRYYTGNWQLIAQQAGAAAGIEVQVIRAQPAPEDAVTDPATVREAILAWRASLRDGAGQPIDGLDWEELPQAEYFTDKPDWDGYWAVRLLAAREEFPAVKPPADVPNPSGLETALASPLAQRIGDVYQVRGGGLRGLFGRGGGSTSGERYPQLQLPEIWLPGRIERPFKGADVVGQPMVIGSVDGLLGELESLNDRTLRADAEQLEAWSFAGPPEDRSLDAVGRFGLAILLQAARYGASHRLPIKLDY